MKKKKQTNENQKGAVYVNESDGLVHSYDVYHNQEGQTLLKYSSFSFLWSEHIRGTVAGSLYDNGDDIYITISGITTRYNYAQMEVLTALIMTCNQTEMEFRKYKVTSSLKPII